jgi:hypothetical protein
MYCPQCRVEYRPGFGRCSDCEVDLVEELAPLNAPEPELDVNSRPDLAPRPFFLAWFVPMCIYVLLIFGSIARPRLIQNFHFSIFIFMFWVFRKSWRFLDDVPGCTLRKTCRQIRCACFCPFYVCLVFPRAGSTSQGISGQIRIHSVSSAGRMMNLDLFCSRVFP